MAWSFNAKSERHAGTLQALSCVIWSSNAAPKLAELLPWLSDLLTVSGHPWEIVVVDVDSVDNTVDLLRRWGAVPAVRCVSVRRQRGDDALATGLSAARGEAVIFFDANQHHSLRLIPQMISHWEDGAEVVYALREGLPERSPLNWFGPSVFDAMSGPAAKRLDWLQDCAELTLLNRRVLACLGHEATGRRPAA